MISRFQILVAAGLFTLSSLAHAEPKILIVGDSHTVGDFGSGLVKSLRDKNYSVAVNAVCGARPASFTGRPYPNKICSWNLGYDEQVAGTLERRKGTRLPVVQLSDSIRSKNPDIVIIAHGTNQLPVKQPPHELKETQISAALAEAKKETEKAIRTVTAAGKKCVWVGPPKEPLFKYTQDIQTRFEAMFKNACAENNCRFISSRPSTNSEDTAKDPMRIHYPGQAGRNWGKNIAEIYTNPGDKQVTSGTPASAGGSPSDSKSSGQSN